MFRVVASRVLKNLKQKSQILVVGAVILLISFAGIYFLSLSSAATIAVNVEPELGSPSDGAEIMSDSAASGGGAISFRKPTVAATSCSSVSQHGIVWKLDKSYPCGKFANGDFWVTPASSGGSVVITSMTPDYSSGRHGWMVNPIDSAMNYDDRISSSFDASKIPVLPYAAKGNSSIVKSISNSGGCGNTSGHPPCLKTAAVLTVLPTVPPNNGSGTFRPPYFGTAKPLYSVSQLQTNLLPALAPVGSGPTLDQIETRFQRVQLDHSGSWRGRYHHPADNYMNFSGTGVSNYGSDLARDNNDAALRLMLSDSVSAKMPALVNYVQAGIDWYGASKGGIDYNADGGHFNGRKLPITFAAILLNDANMKSYVATSGAAEFSENGQVYHSSKAGRALWGRPCGGSTYYTVLNGGSGARDCRDPIEMIDGGEVAGGVYQKCCTSKNFKGASAAVRLLPGAEAVWNYSPFHEYVDRWVSFGTWSNPDPESRFLSRHGTEADTGSYGSSFQNAMYSTYK